MSIKSDFWHFISKAPPAQLFVELGFMPHGNRVVFSKTCFGAWYKYNWYIGLARPYLRRSIFLSYLYSCDLYLPKNRECDGKISYFFRYSWHRLIVNSEVSI